MAILAILLCGLNNSSVMAITLVTIGAITVAMLVPTEQARIWHTFKAMVIYALPMFIVWIFLNGIGASSKTIMLVGYGMCLIVVCFGLMLLLAGWLYKLIARRMEDRSR